MPDQNDTFTEPWQNRTSYIEEMTYINRVKKAKKQERLEQAIEENPVLAELVKNPRLFKAAEIVNQHHKPSPCQAELFEELSQVLLVEWLYEGDSLLSVIFLEDEQKIWRRVAYYMQTNGKGKNSISESELRDIIREYITTHVGKYFKFVKTNEAKAMSRLMIDQLQTEKFIVCPQENSQYSFIHQSFLDYFCACFFVERFGKRGLEAGMTFDELKTEVFAKYWSDESWHGTLILIIGMLYPSFAEQILQYLNNLDAGKQESTKTSLINKCLLEIRN